MKHKRNTFRTGIAAGPAGPEAERPTRAALQARIAELERDRDRLAGIVQNVTQGVALWDPRGRLSVWNRSYEEYLDCKRGALAEGVAFEHVVWTVAGARAASGNASSAAEHVRKRLAHHADPRVPVEFTRPDGRVFMLHEMHLADGSFIETFTDVSELKQREQELELSRDEMEQFAYTASHDLHGPLRGIAHLVRFMEEDLPPDAGAEVREHLGHLQVRVGRMRRLLENLLDYARAGHAQYGARTVDTRALVESLAAEIDRPPALQVTAGPGLPTFHTGRTPLETVLRNLINNAITHHDRAEGRVLVSAEAAGDRYRFRVSDDGPGVPERSRGRIFRAFESASNVRGRIGAGLGLAICDRLVRASGGEIALLEPDGARGACFEFTWPRTWGAGEG